ncbi:ROK family protein [Aeromonas molluscorum]|uniref:N-acetylglucosamine kinase n=1 Tax=Aeromonas molluscorum 848 TaxID=1268236 RepID=R1F7T4_9GAMM|nr:ROK family protein [Aeromonas molluscorum]EOD55802.1 ROK family protein [Aeromonas molluscorum 848]
MYYGFDIGGTKVAFAVYDGALTLCHEERLATPGDDYESLQQIILGRVLAADKRYGVRGTVGIGFPGILNRADKSIVAANLPCINGRHLGADLGARLDREVRVDNDANCFLWSEVHQGAAEGADTALAVTIGTGIGGAVYVNGRLVQGRNWLAGEIGHYPLPGTILMKYPDLPRPRCGCGRLACFETYASGTGLERLYLHLSGERASGQQIVSRFEAREPHAVATLDCWLEIMAAGLATALSVLDPDVVVLGGGLCGLAALYEQLPLRLPGHLLPGVALPEIRQARFGGAGGVRGAALLHL